MVLRWPAQSAAYEGGTPERLKTLRRRGIGLRFGCLPPRRTSRRAVSLDQPLSASRTSADLLLIRAFLCFCQQFVVKGKRYLHFSPR
jgi:hypothetical protein